MIWAIFNEDLTIRVSGYTDESHACDELWCRPEGCFVDRPCHCPVPLPIGRCAACRDLDDEYEDDDDE